MLVAVIDPHPIMADALVQVVHRVAPGAKVVTVKTLHALQELSNEGKLSLIIAEPVYGFGTSLNLLHFLEDGTTPFLLYSSGGPPEEYEPPGVAHGMFLSKSNPVAQLIGVLTKALLGAAPSEKAVAVKLSKRQQQLILALDQGKSNKEIAADFDISEHTVKVHFWRLYKRIGVSSRTTALHYARVNGWL